MKITIYTTNECQFSKQAKDYFAAHNLPFEEKNLESNREFLTEMLAASNNFAGTPVIVVDKENGSPAEVLKGFTQEEVAKATGQSMEAVPAPAASVGASASDTSSPAAPSTPAADPMAPPASPMSEPPAPTMPEPMTPPPAPPMSEPSAPAAPNEQNKALDSILNSLQSNINTAAPSNSQT